MSPDEDYQRIVEGAILDAETFVKATFSGRRRGYELPWRRVTVRPVAIQGARHLQVSHLDEKQDTTKNYTDATARDKVRELLALPFSQIAIVTTEGEIQVQISRKGSVRVSRRRAQQPGEAPPLEHDRRKPYLLPGTAPDPLLQALEIQTPDGQIRAGRQRKYRQINEFLRLIVETEALAQLDTPIRIVDCGCGSADLTFAVYHYLSHSLALPVQAVGVDVKAELMAKQNALAAELGWTDLRFEVSRIIDYQPEEQPDIVLALHACDTATDEALAQAVKWGAHLLMVPLAFVHLVEDRRGSAFLAGLFMGFALLAHYDAMIALPAFGYALLAARWTTGRPWSRILSAACGVLMVTLPFYGPFLLSEGFEFATSYLIGVRISGDGPLFRSNYAEFLSVDAIYNSSYYFLCLGFMLLIAILRDLSRWGRVSLFGILLLIPASIAAAAWGSRWVALGIDWSFLPSALLLGFCVMAPHLSWHRRALWLWFAAAYLFYLFVVADPRTHIYNVYVPGVFLAGDALQWLWRGRLRLWPSPARYSMLGIGIILLALIVGFPFNVFVRTDRDYAAGYPNSRSPIYWGLSTDVPKNVYFGIPRRVGWKAVTELIPDTAPAVLYNSNEVPRITDWYLPQGLRMQCNHPDFYFIDLLHPDNVYSSISVDRNVVDTDYGLVGVVTVADRPSLEIYQRGQVEQAAKIYRDEEFGSAFGRSSTPDRWLRRLPQNSILTPDVLFGDSIALLGYSIETSSIGAGEAFRLVLYWRTSRLVRDTYVVFVHLIKDGVMQQGSGDSLPDCGAQSTSLWVPGELIVDAHEVHAFDDAACEDCGVFVGLYDLYSGIRAPAYILGERTAGDTVYLTTVEIRPDQNTR